MFVPSSPERLTSVRTLPRVRLNFSNLADFPELRSLSLPARATPTHALGTRLPLSYFCTFSFPRLFLVVSGLRAL